MGIGGLNPSLSAKENAPAMVRFSIRKVRDRERLASGRALARSGDKKP